MKKNSEIDIEIDYSISVKKWSNFVRKKEIYELIEAAILASDITKFRKKFGVSIIFAGNKLVQDLNKLYRNKDKETNVISLAANDFSNMNMSEMAIIGDFLMLGDMAFAFEVIKKEAFEQNKLFKNHLKHLIIHSTLHLLGYDHENEEEAKKMENLEIDILKKFDINSPYVI